MATRQNPTQGRARLDTFTKLPGGWLADIDRVVPTTSYVVDSSQTNHTIASGTFTLPTPRLIRITVTLMKRAQAEDATHAGNLIIWIDGTTRRIVNFRKRMTSATYEEDNIYTSYIRVLDAGEHTVDITVRRLGGLDWTAQIGLFFFYGLIEDIGPPS